MCRLFLILILFTSFFSFGEKVSHFIPDDFKELTESQELSYDVELNNSTFIKIKGKGNYFNIESIINKNEFISSLKVKGVKEDSALILFNVINNDECKKICKDDLISNYDYDKLSFSLNIPAYMMRTLNDNDLFNSLKPESNVVVLKNRYYTYFDKEDFNINLNEDGVIGFGKSNINFSQQISKDGYSLDSISYDNQFKNGYALSIFYSDLFSVLDNGASRVDFSSPKERKSIQIKTSDKQLKSSKDNLKKLFFDMKSDGLIKVIVDGKVIKTNFYKKGQNYITYNKLPKGNYLVTLELNPEGYPKEIIKKVINNISTNVSYRGYDYALSINHAKFNESYSENYIIDTKEDENYIEALAVKNLSNDIIFGGSLRANKADVMVGSYINYMLQDLNFSTYFDFSSKGTYLSLDLSILGLSFDYSRKKTNDSLDLIDLIYASDDFEQKSISYSYNSSIGGFRVAYLDYSVEDIIDGNRSDSSLNFYFNKMLFNDIGLDFSYSMYRSKSNDSSKYNDDVFSLAFTIPLRDKIQSSSSVNYSKKSGTRVENFIQYDDLFDNDYNINNSISLSNSISDEVKETSLTFNAYRNDEYHKSSAYAHVDDSGYYSANLNLESSFIISKDKFYLTSQDDDSFIVIDNNVSNSSKNKQEDEFDDYGTINIQKNQMSTQQFSMESDYTVVGLGDYDSYKYNIDTGISNYENSLKSSNGSLFSYPGTAKIINNKLRKAVTFLTYFEDFNNKSVNDIECKGSGCSSVSKVGDGIYSITVFEDEKYKLVSNNEYCLTSKDDIKFNGGVSRCFPSIIEDTEGYQLVSEGFGDENEDIYFLGQISTLLDESRINVFKSYGIDIVKYEFGREKYFLFAKILRENSNESYAMLKTVVNELDAYVSNIDLENLYSNVIVVDE